ncbi:hypothetical protein GLYMA_01G079000v4 [Glycine max]|uniref:Uncharacterized protein n=1 Tax=Glycine max TaxID=3847 RepID=A0A0R0LD43_SOYBN|nr:hypothetical protein JHK87_000883 [Glycine soja]KAG5068522.1 hypothetical protein JHK85_000899 [Glycine max]KAG5088257.1 hypothetical protein JHK86_000869 [Glycine max]KAH1162131.1 hypothetical protein GYH30_000848 [Glycine max]KAH1265248.1 hypothetical protein GmHk_01G000994 [Glycine max]
MSFTYHLFFICIFLHACSARCFSTLHNKLEKKPHFSIKGDEINGVESFCKHLAVANEVNYKIKPRKAKTTNQKVLKAIRKIQKPSKKDPGFNLDYSLPKTHPPSHI